MDATKAKNQYAKDHPVFLAYELERLRGRPHPQLDVATEKALMRLSGEIIKEKERLDFLARHTSGLEIDKNPDGTWRMVTTLSASSKGSKRGYACLHVAYGKDFRDCIDRMMAGNCDPCE